MLTPIYIATANAGQTPYQLPMSYPNVPYWGNPFQSSHQDNNNSQPHNHNNHMQPLSHARDCSSRRRRTSTPGAPHSPNPDHNRNRSLCPNHDRDRRPGRETKPSPPRKDSWCSIRLDSPPPGSRRSSSSCSPDCFSNSDDDYTKSSSESEGCPTPPRTPSTESRFKIIGGRDSDAKTKTKIYIIDSSSLADETPELLDLLGGSFVLLTRDAYVGEADDGDTTMTDYSGEDHVMGGV